MKESDKQGQLGGNNKGHPTHQNKKTISLQESDPKIVVCKIAREENDTASSTLKEEKIAGRGSKIKIMKK